MPVASITKTYTWDSRPLILVSLASEALKQLPPFVKSTRFLKELVKGLKGKKFITLSPKKKSSVGFICLDVCSLCFFLFINRDNDRVEVYIFVIFVFTRILKKIFVLQTFNRS